MAKLNGTAGRVSVGGEIVEITSWGFNTKEESLETTHSESAGYKASIGGVKSGDGSFEGDWDAAASPHASPPDLTIGTVPIYIRLHVNAAKYYALTSVRITGMDVKCEVKGKVTYTCTFETTGAWTQPT